MREKKIKLLHDDNVFKNKNIRISGKNIIIKGKSFCKFEKDILPK